MPYIKESLRDLLDDEIEALGEKITTVVNNEPDAKHRDGLVNYAITKLLLKVYPETNYHVLNESYGVLLAAAAEYYRRRVAPYEDSKIWENGDAYPNPIQPKTNSSS